MIISSKNMADLRELLVKLKDRVILYGDAYEFPAPASTVAALLDILARMDKTQPHEARVLLLAIHEFITGLRHQLQINDPGWSHAPDSAALCVQILSIAPPNG